VKAFNLSNSTSGVSSRELRRQRAVSQGSIVVLGRCITRREGTNEACRVLWLGRGAHLSSSPAGTSHLVARYRS